MRRRFVCMDYVSDKRVMNYFKDNNKFSSYYYACNGGPCDVYALIKNPKDIAFDQILAREDYKKYNGRVVFYEELYDWE